MPPSRWSTRATNRWGSAADAPKPTWSANHRVRSSRKLRTTSLGIAADDASGQQVPRTRNGERASGRMPKRCRTEPQREETRLRAWRAGARTRGQVRAMEKKKPRSVHAAHSLEAYEKKLRQRPTLPQRHRCSTIGSEELNFRVRDGIGWNLFDITTGKLWIASQPEFRDRALPPRETRRRAVELHQYCL